MTASQSPQIRNHCYFDRTIKPAEAHTKKAEPKLRQWFLKNE
jgi:hypothetical protein